MKRFIGYTLINKKTNKFVDDCGYESLYYEAYKSTKGPNEMLDDLWYYAKKDKIIKNNFKNYRIVKVYHLTEEITYGQRKRKG